MSDYPMLISNKLHSFRNFSSTNITFSLIFSETDNCMLRIFFIFGDAEGVVHIPNNLARFLQHRHF